MARCFFCRILKQISSNSAPNLSPSNFYRIFKIACSSSAISAFFSKSSETRQCYFRALSGDKWLLEMDIRAILGNFLKLLVDFLHMGDEYLFSLWVLMLESHVRKRFLGQRSLDKGVEGFDFPSSSSNFCRFSKLLVVLRLSSQSRIWHCFFRAFSIEKCFL